MATRHSDPPGGSGAVTLLMAIHCHQPVGNFGFVFEEAYAKAYDPFLGALERHPHVRLALHYSGCLLDWLLAHRPEFLARVRRLVSRGQVELLASGYYEPILPLIPEPDRQGQIAAMREALRRHCGAEADGLWLTERVWEPDLPATLARAGIRYTMVDVNQFASARPWLPSARQVEEEPFWDVLGCYSTDYAGASTIIFPASKRLRYWLPFQPVERTIEFLRRMRREGSSPAAITFADDGEKFGLWPKTHQWVYEEGWLERFLTALEEERGWLTTTTFHDYLQHASPDARAYLPSGSYEEMLEWSGGHFRNFFAKYPEANAMQQKMLRVSQELREVSNDECRMSNRKKRSTFGARHSKLAKEAQRALYEGQCNCAYWHGVFGGLYLSHLRRAVYARLMTAERLIQRLRRQPVSVGRQDVDGDGREEAIVRTATMGLVIDPDEGGALTEWSLYGPRLNLLDTLSRRREPYHEKLTAKARQAVASSAGVPASIHDALGVKEPGLAARLIYDDHRRSAFLDFALDEMPTLQDVATGSWGERRLWFAEPFRWENPRGTTRVARGRACLTGRRGRPPAVSLVREQSGGRIRKTFRASATGSGLECLYELTGLAVPVVGVEFNLSLRDERYLERPGQVAQASRFRVAEPSAGVALEVSIEPPATLFHLPVETVSESEEGLERIYQGLCLLCCWAPTEPAGRWTSRLQWTVEETG